MSDRLRPLWDFDDLDVSERRLRDQLDREETAAGRAEVLTQLARLEGLRGRFDDAEGLLHEGHALDAETPVVRARLDLERGRVLRSSGQPASALPLFEAAFAVALEAGEEFIAADAAHMAALVAGGRADMLAWTERGIELAERSPGASYWLGPLLNKLGWELYEAGEFAGALAAFERALAARERDPEHPYEIEIARYAVAKALRALERSDEAVPLLERAVSWAEATHRPDSFFREELAENHAALGRRAEASEQAAQALALVEPDDPRAERLRALVQLK
jgi:tetratricopeptide (TPR) repeat protein